MKKEIETLNPQKILSWIGAPYMAASIFEGVVLLIGFSPILFVNYLMEALFLYLFFLSCKNKYNCYKNEPNLGITKYFWIELGIHIIFMVASIVQSVSNVWIKMTDSGLVYTHEFLFISLMIWVLHTLYMCIDYYASGKAAIIRYYKRMKKEKKL